MTGNIPQPPQTYQEFVRRFPKIGQAWEELAEAGRDGPLDDRTARLIKLAVAIGNLREGARLKLGHFGLYDHFAFGGFGDHHWERDDVAREALAAVQAHLNGRARAERIWVIGDTPLDVRCARAIGARAVAVATGWHTAEATPTRTPC